MTQRFVTLIPSPSSSPSPQTSHRYLKLNSNPCKTWWFLKKLNVELPLDSAILLPGIYPTELKIHPHKNLYTSLQSNIILRKQKWKHPKWRPADGQINQMSHIHTMKWHSAMKRNELVIHVITNIDEPYKYAKWKKPDAKGRIWFYFYEMSRVGKAGCREKEWGVIAKE